MSAVTRSCTLLLILGTCLSCQDQRTGSTSTETEPEVASGPSAGASTQAPGDERRTVRPLKRTSPEVVEGPVLDSAFIARLSAEMIQRTGDGIGLPRESRFLDRGRLVVVLDRFEPYLRLFTADGDSLWHGGSEGGGPKELQDPQVVLPEGDSVVVFQPGRISRWVLDDDTLAFDQEFPLPLNLFPLGAVQGCVEDILFYARNDAQLLGEDARIEYLHALKKPFDSKPLEVVWSEEWTPDAIQTRGHTAMILSRYADQFVLLHRSRYPEAGEILEMDCRGTILRRHSERSLATGDTIEVLAPRGRAMEWTAGVVAIPGGFVTAQHRYYSRRFYAIPAARYRTELFLFLGGRYRGSVLIPRQWILMDMHPNAGILMASIEPRPHFIRVPIESILSSVDRSGSP